MARPKRDQRKEEHEAFLAEARARYEEYARSPAPDETRLRLLKAEVEDLSTRDRSDA